VKALGASNFLVKCDGKVIKDHVEKESEDREPELVKYLAEVGKMERHFRGFTVEHLPKKTTAKPTRSRRKLPAMPPDVFFEVLTACVQDQTSSRSAQSTQSLAWTGELP
jgi:hypothetical protein